LLASLCFSTQTELPEAHVILFVVFAVLHAPPLQFIAKQIWKERYEDINAFERYLTRNGIVVLKVFLHLSKKEQKKRFLSRLEDPEKKTGSSPWQT
jgi:polyphosphate kinase 2 (PPK2 family)